MAKDTKSAKPDKEKAPAAKKPASKAGESDVNPVAAAKPVAAKPKADTPSTLTGAGSAPAVSALTTPPVDLDAISEDDEIVLTDAEGRRYCRATDCDQIGIVDGYCRYHYLYFWKKIQNRKKIIADGKLERYVDELTSRYSDKFVELLRKDLRTEKDFVAALQELDLDDATQAQDSEDDKTYLEEIRGMGDETSSARDDDF